MHFVPTILWVRRQQRQLANRVAAFGILIGLVGYVVWVWAQPRSVGRGPWTVTLPGGPVRLPSLAIHLDRGVREGLKLDPQTQLVPVWGARTDRDPDIVLGIEELSAAYLGGVSLASLQAAGRVHEVSPGAVVQASTGFGWPVTPWCPDEF